MDSLYITMKSAEARTNAKDPVQPRKADAGPTLMLVAQNDTVLILK